jgi:hypothetical protein
MYKRIVRLYYELTNDHLAAKEPLKKPVPIQLCWEWDAVVDTDADTVLPPPPASPSLAGAHVDTDADTVLPPPPASPSLAGAHADTVYIAWLSHCSVSASPSPCACTL